MTIPSIEQHIPTGAREICRTLHQNGHGAWLVGGCVRDCLLGALLDRHPTIGDWDVATDAKPEQVVQMFRRVIPTGIAHGTVTVHIGTESFEVTTLRAETTYSDGRRPDSVDFVQDIEADLARRDFTVNAIAYDPHYGALIDPFDGQSDIRARRLRAVGEARERFREDGLRVLRAARFVSTLQFELEEGTYRAIEPSLDSFRKVSAERVRDEWWKALASEQPSRSFEVMKNTGILAVTAPELLETVGCEQNKYHEFDVWGHTMACMDACPRAPRLRLAGLLHDVGKPRSRQFSDKTEDYTFYNHELIGAEMARPMLERLRVSNADRDRIVGLVRHHLICYSDEWSNAAVRRWLRRVTPELAEDLYALGRADALGKGRDATDDIENLLRLRARVERLLAEGAAVRVSDLAITGGDLIAELHLKPGPLFGSILQQLLEEVTEEPERNERETLLARARELSSQAEQTH